MRSIGEKSLGDRISDIPADFSTAIRSAWIGRERGLAVFAGVFLASLVITTVFAYGVGLSQGALQNSLNDEVYDAKVDFSSQNDWSSRTNDSAEWGSVCDELLDRVEIIDCGLVYGRQGLRLSGFFDEGFALPQPLNVIEVSGPTGNWDNVSWDYPEALENGPSINGDRIMRIVDPSHYDGELADRYSNRVVYGSWPSGDQPGINPVILPSKIASQAGIRVNDTIDSLNFTYVTDAQVIGSELKDCEGEIITRDLDAGVYQFCTVTMTLSDLTIVAVYEEWPFTNPTLLFNPVIVGDSALSISNRTTLVVNDHAYLGIAIDRNLLPTSSTDDAADWLDANRKNLEDQGYGPDGEIKIEYNDLISGTIVFLRIFLGLVQVFDYILMIPIVILSFAVLIYGLILSLEQRKREISIHRVIGGTERGLRGMVMRELAAISIAGWILGYLVALLSVPLILDAVGFMSFEKGDLDVNPTLGLGYTMSVFLLTVGIAYLVARGRTKDFLEMEIDEGVRKVRSTRKPKTWLQVLAFGVGLLAALESYIETRGGWGPWGASGIISGFFVDSLLALFGPFALWIGGALVLGRIGGAAPRIVLKIIGWTPAMADIRRGLRSSGSNESVNRLAVILLLTLSIVTLAAVQGYTGTLVDERTASAQVGADLQVQFEGPVSEDVARQRVNAAMNTLDNRAVDSIQSMTSVGSTFVTAQQGGGLVPALVLFDNHEDTLIWDSQASPIINYQSSKVTIGENAVDFFNVDDGTVEIFFPTFTPVITGTGFEISTTYTSTSLDYEGRHEWIPGMTGSESTQAVLIGESTYRELAGNSTVDTYTSPRWFFEVCDQTDSDCQSGLERLSAELLNIEGVSLALDWNTAHSEVERNGGLIFGTQGLLSLQFVVASMASVASAFVFLSLVLTQRKKELAILQAIGASPSQIIKLVLFEILAIVGMSMGLGILLGLGIAQSFNGFFAIFGFLFQIFLGSQAVVDRTLVWPWMELAFVNVIVLVSVIAALLLVTRRALNSDLAVVLKGE